MTRRKKAVFNWSGGKDSALALHKALIQNEFDIVSLITTINGDNERSTMHGIPLPLLEKQAASIGIPFRPIRLLPGGEMAGYDRAMQEIAEHFKGQGVEHFIFGDIFLHDVKSYREKKLRPLGIQVVEPLWGHSARAIMDEFLASGIKAVIVTTNADLLDQSYAGRLIDTDFVQSLPEGVDICGENGEYHSFCFDGPLFRHPIPYQLGEPLLKTYPVRLDDGTTQTYRYWFANLRE